MADSVQYNDPTPNNFPDDYNQKDVDNRTALRTAAIRDKMYGKDVREAIAEGVEISSVVSGQAKKTADDSNALSKDTQAQFKAVQQGATSDTEVKTARYSKADGKTYDVLTDRLDAMDAKPQQAVDDLKIGGTNLLKGTGDHNVTGTATKGYLSNETNDDFLTLFKGLEGQTVTISVDYKYSGFVAGSDRNRLGWEAIVSTSSIPYTLGKWYYPDNDSGSGRIYSTLVVPENITKLGYANGFIQFSGSGTATLSHLKLEKGSKATDWSPAPQDSHHHQAFRKGTRFFAHRGAQSIAPENSLPAIDKAGNHAGVEIDIHVTSDDVWVVMHDGTVDRMTNGTGAISSFTFDNIRKLRFDAGSKINRLSDEEKIIPSLEEVLAHCKNRQLIPVIEIKVDSTDKYTSDNYNKLADIINKFGLADECMFISFNYQALQEIKKRLPLVEVSWLVGTINPDNITQAQQLGVNSGLDVNYVDKSMNASYIANNVTLCHNAGLKVGVWTLPNDDARALVTGAGVDFVTTNSLSGERRYADISCKNGWSNYNGDTVSYVQEVAPNIINLRFTIIGDESGTVEKGKPFATIPEWAKPSYDIWNPCIVKMENGEVYQSSFDIVRNELRVGIHWEKKASSNGWATGNVTYHI